MIKYAKVVNQETGICEIAIGTNEEFYKSIGWQKLDVQQSDKDNKWYLTSKCPMKSEEELLQEEKMRIAEISLTRADVFEALIMARGITKKMLREYIEKDEMLSDIQKLLYLNRFDDALEFYRKHPAIDFISAKLGISSENMDKFFDTKDYNFLK